MKKIMIVIALSICKIAFGQTTTLDSTTYLVSWLYMEEKQVGQDKMVSLKPGNEIMKVPIGYGTKELLNILTTTKKNVMYLIANVPLSNNRFLLRESTDMIKIDVEYIVVDEIKNTMDQVHFVISSLIYIDGISFDVITETIKKEEGSKRFVITNIYQR